jgi:hypothetical protein
VVGRLHIIRRSPHTHKVTEDTEFLTFDPPLPQTVSVRVLLTSADASAPIQQATAVTEGDVSSHGPYAHVSRSGERQLITFDANDPEFEDEDPDADLDL